MTYATKKQEFGHEPIWVVEIHLGYCSNEFSVAPCTASGASGTECFNCFNSCQDIPNFDETNPAPGDTTKIYRFSSTNIDPYTKPSSTYIIDNAPTFPTLKSVSTAPARLTPGKGLGIRSTCNIKLVDFPWTDIGIDPYVEDRTYDPDSQGTFWGKLLARNPYYEGRKIIVKTGFLDDNNEFNSTFVNEREYFIDSITGPDANGNVSIKGKDILRFADSSKAQLPSASAATLSGDIIETTTSLPITDPSDDIYDAFNDSPSQPYIKIDDEVMLITSMTGSNPSYVLTVQRSTLPSFYPGPMTAEEHEDKATVQNCYLFEGERIDDVCEYLLETVAGIDSAYIPKADWVTTIDYGLQGYEFSTLIVEPTGVKELLTEITEHSIMLWWDERDSEIKLDSILSSTPSATIYNDEDHIVADSVKVARDDSARTSQVWMSLGHRNPVLDMDELKNFAKVEVVADLTLEGVNAYDQKRVNMISSRWLPIAESNVAGEIVTRLNNYYKNTKRMITITLNPKDDSAWTGDLIQVQTNQLQDEFGAPLLLTYRILQVNEKLKPDKTEFSYILQDIGDNLRYANISPDTYTTLFTSASDNDKEIYFFIGNDDGTMSSDGSTAYKIV